MREPIICVDVDEVLADLLTEWVHRYNIEWGDKLRVEDITGWDMKQFVKKACGGRIYEILRQPGFYECVQPFDGARAAVQELRKLGRVIFLTSCARNTIDAKYTWLVRHGFKPTQESFIACKDKYLVQGDILLDDAVHNVEAWRGKAALLIEHQHNLLTPVRPDIERIKGGIGNAPPVVERVLGFNPA